MAMEACSVRAVADGTIKEFTFRFDGVVYRKRYQTSSNVRLIRVYRDAHYIWLEYKMNLRDAPKDRRVCRTRLHGNDILYMDMEK